MVSASVITVIQWLFDLIPPVRLFVQKMLAHNLEIEIIAQMSEGEVDVALPSHIDPRKLVFYLVPLAICVTNHAREPNRIRRVTGYVERGFELPVLNMDATSLDLYIEPLRTETIHAYAIVPFTAHIMYILYTPDPKPLNLTFHRVGGLFRKQRQSIPIEEWFNACIPSTDFICGRRERNRGKVI